MKLSPWFSIAAVAFSCALPTFAHADWHPNTERAEAREINRDLARYDLNSDGRVHPREVHLARQEYRRERERREYQAARARERERERRLAYVRARAHADSHWSYRR
jgi:hypothetical protein